MKIRKRIKIRKEWVISPVTKVKKSKKLYKRTNNKKAAKKDVKELLK
jgi:hypothetical protein